MMDIEEVEYFKALLLKNLKYNSKEIIYRQFSSRYNKSSSQAKSIWQIAFIMQEILQPQKVSGHLSYT